jgi:hypothetical protein
MLPDEKLLSEMGKFNEEMEKAGILIDLSGLQPTSKGTRVKFSGGNKSVTDGPFAETKELIAGYWLIRVKSKQEAVDWALRAPMQEAEIEIRALFELDDFPSVPAEVRELEERMKAAQR